MHFLEDAQFLFQAGSYQEALKILDNRLMYSNEIPPKRLAQYYCSRSLCLALTGNMEGSISDYQAFVSHERRIAKSTKYGFCPKAYLASLLQISGFPEGSENYERLKGKLLKLSPHKLLGKLTLFKSKLPDEGSHLEENNLLNAVSNIETNEVKDVQNDQKKSAYWTVDWTVNLVEEETKKIKDELLDSLHSTNFSVDKCRSACKALEQGVYRLDRSVKGKASLRRLRAQARSFQASLDKLDSRLIEKISRLESDRDCFNDRIDSLMLILESPDSRIDFKRLAEASQRTFLTRVAYRIPPLRIITLGILASSGFFFTQLVLASSFPRHVDPHDSDPSAMIVSLPYPISRAREFLRKTFLIHPDKSAEIIRQKYPGFGRH